MRWNLKMKAQEQKNRRQRTENRGQKTVICHPSSVFRLQGFTLIELTMAIAASCIVMMSVAMLVASGQKSWARTFNTTYSECRLGSLDTMIALGSVGRKSNKMNYRIYKFVSGKYQRAVPVFNPEEVVVGQAVEFRYWGDDLKADYMDPAKTADKYALFYLDNKQLKVDYGPYDPPANPGGINASGDRTTGAGITTITLTENISEVDFSHTTYNMTGDGYGCVRMKLVIADPVSGSPKTTIAATFLRNIWPP